MAGDDIGRLIYLILLAAAIAGYFFVENRNRLGKTAQQAAIWGLIFLGVVAGVGLWSDIRQQVSPRQTVFEQGQRIEVPRAPDGHFYLTLLINDTPVRFVVDTGASEIVLTQKDALRVGVDLRKLDYLGQAHTANGVVETARVTLDEVRLGPVMDENMRAWVNRGEMQDSLLGMTYLQRFARMEIADNRLILTR
ncbi:aspartyl protease family protein [Rhodovulum imhoffii]|uniref:Aspartyl protease family protein n=1 Tax=Rhodovulum imhoffii TaxID=365340 RepID=A0A2T5BVK4_9RHOB|nr:TIGR02281 family clan AA aspartic protease [Rhodovulum imhoffii]MBK5932822.1 aspartyl protease [Rhodovulum imhoffii]PTN03609.1 aspartyl protease family protein [Rhodovulum imhoffii]